MGDSRACGGCLLNALEDGRTCGGIAQTALPRDRPAAGLLTDVIRTAAGNGNGVAATLCEGKRGCTILEQHQRFADRLPGDIAVCLRAYLCGIGAISERLIKQIERELGF